MSTSRPDLVEGLTSSQIQAVTTESPTVCVLASAGAGKTRVLTRRAAYRVATGSAQADHVLAITFTRKAAGELRQRLAGLGGAQEVTAGTFHSVALSQLRRWWADRRTPEPALLGHKARLVSELTAGRPGLADIGAGELAGHLEWAKARLVPPAAFADAARAANRELPADAEAIAGLYARYEDEKRRRRLVDFDDLLARYAGALEADSRFAAAQRWKWQHVFVDELQDVNPLQYRLLLALLGDNEDLFVVGDPNQAIYGWNGAEPTFLSEFPAGWPRAEVVRLDDNHRSSPQVVAAAVAVLGRQAGGPVRSSRPDGPLPSLSCFPCEKSEAAAVASQVLEAHRGGLPWDEMAVLARTNSQLEVIGRALAGAGAPVQAFPSGEYAGDEPEQAAPPPGRDEQKVTVSTFHRAKGLQWAAVWVCGLESGLVPIAYASSPGALAEERRLLYVALTRARRELHCSWARERRTAGGALLRRDPSPWVSALAAHCAGTGAEPAAAHADAAGRGTADKGRGATAIAFLASARRRLPEPRSGYGCAADGPAGPESKAVAEGLRDWRRRLARASGVPPHVLLHDSAVQVIADRRPATTEELLAVPGVGPVKVARYGPAILEVVRQRAGAA